jgi:hypothetical protein
VVSNSNAHQIDGSADFKIGPNTAARDIKKACKAATVREVNFSFWKEHF